MAAFPVQSSIGDPLFRIQGSSVDAVRRFTRVAADASVKLNSQERIVNPGDDALSFSTSRRIRADITTLKTVQETGQLNVTGLSLAIDALEGIKVQLDQIKRQLVQSQVADSSERDSIQAEIDLAIAQIESTAQNTKLGSRRLLDGSSTIKAYADIAADGTKTAFSVFASGASLTSTNSVRAVTVNKVGIGGPTFTDNAGRSILSFRASLLTGATRPAFSLTAGTAGSFAEFRVTGKLGSTTVRILSDAATLAGQLEGTAAAMNKLAQETGVVLVSDANGVQLTTVGYGSDEFIKVELLSFSSGATAASFGNGANAVGGATAVVGEAVVEYGLAATARINGNDIMLGGANGTTARYLSNGFDINVDFTTSALEAGAVTVPSSIHIDLTDGVVGLLGASGDSRDTVHYGFGNFTTENLGRGNAQYAATQVDDGTPTDQTDADRFGNMVINSNAVADLGSGGGLSLKTGNFGESMRTIDRAVEQVIREQTRLGVLQSNFVDAIQRSEVQLGNLSSADADIIGVDAATEITNLVQAQLGVSTATSLIAQANNMQQTIFSLLRA